MQIIDDNVWKKWILHEGFNICQKIYNKKYYSGNLPLKIWKMKVSKYNTRNIFVGNVNDAQYMWYEVKGQSVHKLISILFYKIGKKFH